MEGIRPSIICYNRRAFGDSVSFWATERISYPFVVSLSNHANL